MPKIKTPRTVAFAGTDIDYPFKDMAINAIKALIPLAEDDSAPTSQEAAKKAIKAIDTLARVVLKAYADTNEAAQDLDVQTMDGNPANLMVFLNIICFEQQAMEVALHTRHRSKSARIVSDLAFGQKKEELMAYFGLKEKEEK